MAVTTWTAGQVLAAQDLNDTFASKADYPSGGTDGQALVKSGTTTAWANLGLVRVATSTVSAVSTISFNNCFSAEYLRYRIIWFGTTSSGSTEGLRFRLRSGGSDSTNNNYNWQQLDVDNTTVSASRSTSQNNGQLGSSTTSGGWFVADFMNPFVAATTYYVSHSARTEGTVVLVDNYGTQTVASSYDGFTLFGINGSNLTGTLTIWAYNN